MSGSISTRTLSSNSERRRSEGTDFERNRASDITSDISSEREIEGERGRTVGGRIVRRSLVDSQREGAWRKERPQNIPRRVKPTDTKQAKKVRSLCDGDRSVCASGRAG